MKRISVAIITSNYWPEKTGIGQVTTEFAEYLTSNGVHVSVATALPYYPEWRIHEEYRRQRWETEEHEGVVIHRAAHYAAPNPTTLGRIWHELTLCALAKRCAPVLRCGGSSEISGLTSTQPIVIR